MAHKGNRMTVLFIYFSCVIFLSISYLIIPEDLGLADLLIDIQDSTDRKGEPYFSSAVVKIKYCV